MSNAPQLSYAGFPLLQNNIGFHNFLNGFQGLQDGNFFCTPFNTITPKNLSIEGLVGGCSLGHLNYPDPAIIQINKLVQPIGASRWSWFIGVMSNPFYEQLIDQLSPGDPNNLIIGTQTEQMYLLASKQIHAVDTGNDNPSWLLILVDCRWYFQFIDTGTLSLTSSSTYSDVFNAIKSAIETLDFSCDLTTVSSDYGAPDWIELSRQYTCVANFMDVVADGVNRRWVPADDGIQMVAPSNTDPVVMNRTSIGSNWQQITGETVDADDDTILNAPANLIFAFQDFANNRPVCTQKFYTISKIVSDNLLVVPNTELVINTTMFADYTSSVNSGSGIAGMPANQTTLNYFATVYASDYYAWRQFYFDVCLTGTPGWTFTGFEDRVETMWQSSRICQRAISMPYNFGTNCNYSQDSSLIIVNSNTNLVQVTADVAKSSYAICHILDSTGSSTGVSITAWAVNAQLASNTQLYAEYNCADYKWDLFTFTPRDLLGTVASTFTTTDGTFSFQQTGVLNGYASSVMSSPITVVNTLSQFAGGIGAAAWVREDLISGNFYAIWVSCAS